NDVLEPRTERLERAFDLVDREVHLRGGIRPADDAIPVRRGRARYVDARAAPRRTGETGEALPRRAAQAKHAPVGAAAHRVRRWERLHVMTQVPGGREKRRLAVLVAAVAGNRMERRERCFQLLAIPGGQREGKDTQVVGNVLPLSGPGADDDAGHGRLL